MKYLVDTNLFLRRAQKSIPQSSSVERVVGALLRNGDDLYFTPQNISEFWAVATRPVDKIGLGLPTGMLLAAVLEIESVFSLLPDSPAVYEEWKRLVARHNVLGKQVYDARLAAVARVYGVGRILTFNTVDFRRFGGITVVRPDEI